eukprot:TRINITY_DN4450_c1_g1_i1.p1 TRINITY_DN4450_c1_g1~~TRINITY_DN4450_c1_g1_i1.p1  ORF type:complete len:869 (+),score=173.35 TRINITY_DN4450_c1_g1_i1:85-2691(+)
MSFFENLFSSLSAVLDGDNPNYGSWSYSLESKIETVITCLGLLMEKSDRLGKLQDTLRRVQLAMAELTPELEVEIFAGDQRSIQHQQHVRTCLIKLWNRLLIVMEKVGEPRYLVLFLDVISKICVRSEFDCENVNSRSPTEVVSEFRRYKKLMFMTFEFVCDRLAEAKPLPITAPLNYQLELPRAYAKLLAIFFFRIPEANKEILHCFQIPPEFVTYNPLDYEYAPQSVEVGEGESHPNSFPSPPVSARRRPGMQKRAQTQFGGNASPNPGSDVTPSPTKSAEEPTSSLEEGREEGRERREEGGEERRASSLEGDKEGTNGGKEEGKASEEKIKTPEEKINELKEPHTQTQKDRNPGNEHFPFGDKRQERKERREREKAEKERTRLSPGQIYVEPFKPLNEDLSFVSISVERNLKIPRNSSHIQDFPRIFAWPEFHAFLKSLDEKSQQKNSNSVPEQPPQNLSIYNFFPVRTTAPAGVTAANTATAATIATTAETTATTASIGVSASATTDGVDLAPSASSGEPTKEGLSEQIYVKQELKAWHNWLYPSSSVLSLFVISEVINHVTSMATKPWFLPIPDSNSVKVVTGRKKIEWRAIRGFKTFINIFLHTLRHAPRFTPSLMSTCSTLLKTCPVLINYYMRFTCTRTIAFDQSAVTDVLTRMAEWFSELKKVNTPLPPNFDADFFNSAMGVILESDHHQMICRVIQLLYHGSEVLLGNVRKAVFADFLVKKYFFILFLHWDEVSRNYFMQLLLFKVLRYKASQLSGNDNVVGIPKSRSGVALSDTEFNNDRALHGKVLCYLKVIEDQLRQPQSQPHPLLSPHLEVYATRAMKEYRYLTSRSEAYQGTEWKVAPMMLIDPNFRVAVTGK